MIFLIGCRYIKFVFYFPGSYRLKTYFLTLWWMDTEVLEIK